MTPQKPKRAPKGSIDTALLVRLPGQLAEFVASEAERLGFSRAEFVRDVLLTMMVDAKVKKWNKGRRRTP